MPWIDRLLAAPDSLDLWQRRLVYYAMYYLSATIMLRDQQLAELSIDAMRTEEVTRPNGTTYVRHVLDAHLTKNRRAPVRTEVVVAVGYNNSVRFSAALAGAGGFSAEAGDADLRLGRLTDRQHQLLALIATVRAAARAATRSACGWER